MLYTEGHSNWILNRMFEAIATVAGGEKTTPRPSLGLLGPRLERHKAPLDATAN